MANVEGKATAITVLTPVKPWARPLLALVFWAGRHLTFTLKKLQQLSFIHFAHWAVIPRFPGSGRRELKYSYLLFESNFNGTWDQYIDAFSEVVPARMKGDLGDVVRLPRPPPGRAVQGLHPAERVPHEPLLVRLSGRRRRPRSSRRSASPTRSMPSSASPRGLPPDAFAAAYARFLTEIQADL